MSYSRFLPLAMAFCANFILGISSVYWHLFETVSPVTLVVFRVIFSMIILAAILLVTARLRELARAVTPAVLALHVLAAVLVATNWGTFIWASITGSVIESGLGYLVAPVVTMSFGILFQGEAIYRAKLLSIATIVATLAVLVFLSGDLDHWVYWTIGVTWGGYTVLKKRTPLNPVGGLFVETIVLLSIIIVGARLFDTGGHIASFDVLGSNPWLAMCGVVSVAPLVMFSYSAQKLDAYSMGALQFVLPTVQLFLSILYYDREVSSLTYGCFGLIWLTLCVATYIDIHRRRSAERAKSPAEPELRQARFGATRL
jgi:chloramphenicol-sensitive protein RarD